MAIKYIQQSELDQYLKDNPNSRVVEPPKKPGLIGGFVKGLTDPFAKFAKNAFTAGEYLSAKTGGVDMSTFDPTLLNQDEWTKLSKDPLGEGIKTAAGVASFAVPGGGIAGAVKSGALYGLSQTENLMDPEEVLKNVVTGGIGGGATAGAFKVAGAGLKGLQNSGITSKLSKFADNRELNAFKRQVGAPAPAKLGGAKFEKEAFGLAKKMGKKITNADDLLTFSDDIYSQYGTKVADDAARLSQQGSRVLPDDVLKPLEELKNSYRMPKDKAQIQGVIDELGEAFKAGDSVFDAYQLKQQVGPKGKFSPVYDPNLKPQFEAYNKAYKTLNEAIESRFKEAGINDFKQTNKLLEIGLKSKQWAETAQGRVRPQATLNDMVQDVAGFGAIATGNPLVAAPGAIAGKALQSPRLEQGIAKGARGLAGVIDNAQLPKLDINVSPTLQNVVRQTTPILGAQQMFAQGGPSTDPIMADTYANDGISANYASNEQTDPVQLMQELMAQGYKTSDAIRIAEFVAKSESGGMGRLDQQQAANLRTGLRSLDDIEQILAQDSGVLYKTKLPGFAQGSNARQFDTAIQQVTDVIGRLRSGGAITEDEESRFRAFLPKAFDDPETINYKINQMRMMLNDASRFKGNQPALVDQYAYEDTYNV